MKLIITLISFIVLGAFAHPSFAQNTAQEEFGGSLPARTNDAAHPCISKQQYEFIEKRCAENIKTLHLDNKEQRTTTSTTFSWPLEPANGLNDCGYYVIFNYVDEDTTSGIKDYNCGAVTYDGHRGTDIGTEPYPFYKMDHNEVNVIAAAPGTIIEKSDGFFDRNCAMNSDTANYIIIQHTDGSVALYWHMKKFSLTSKVVGQTVVAGEFLGVVGSSGAATGPHLHFEVWSTISSSSLRDPWSGACNHYNPASWWAAQKPYTEPAVLKAQVNMLPVVLPGCDTTETPNEDSCFAPGVTAKFYFFLRNETAGDTVHERIINPDGSNFLIWTHNSLTNYLYSYWYFNRVLPSIAGTYTYETKYNGITCSKNFTVSCATLGVQPNADDEKIRVFPNPANTVLDIALNDVDNAPYSLTLRNIVGQVVSKDIEEITTRNGQRSIPVAAFPNGIYFLEVASGKMRIVKKIIIQN